MPKINPTSERVFFADGARFYSELADGLIGQWELSGAAPRGIPADAKLVRFAAHGEASPANRAELHTKEIAVARDMAAAQERARLEPQVRAATARAEHAESWAEQGLAASRRKLDAARRQVDEQAMAWTARLDRLIEIGDRIGQIWDEGPVGTEETSAWYDAAPEGGTPTRHSLPASIDRLLDRLDQVTSADHPSITYPRPALGVVGRAAQEFRRRIGAGAQIEAALTGVLAELAVGERSDAERSDAEGAAGRLARGRTVWVHVPHPDRWLPGTVKRVTLAPGRDDGMTDVDILVSQQRPTDPTSMTVRVVVGGPLPVGVLLRGPSHRDPNVED